MKWAFFKTNIIKYQQLLNKHKLIMAITF